MWAHRPWHMGCGDLLQGGNVMGVRNSKTKRGQQFKSSIKFDAGIS